MLLKLECSSLILENPLVQLLSTILSGYIIILVLIHHDNIGLLVANQLNIVFLPGYHVWWEILILLPVVKLLAKSKLLVVL